MGDTHSKSFFGQNARLIVNTPSKTEPFFFMRCIKKKPEGVWEKPSKGEGKVIKFSIEEAVMILQVLNRKLLTWKSYHTYKDNKTTISFNWEDDKAKTLWINIANYSKMLNFSQAEILRLLLTHILNEKIKYATHSNRKKSSNLTSNEKFSNHIDNSNEIIEFKEDKNDDQFEDNSNYNNGGNNRLSPNPKFSNTKSQERNHINGTIKGETNKALLITFNSGQDLWIPKSTIHSEFLSKKDVDQTFLIDTWVLKKNKVFS